MRLPILGMGIIMFLGFIDRGDDGDNFFLNIYRDGHKLTTHRMRGRSDYFLKPCILRIGHRFVFCIVSKMPPFVQE